jgi:GTP-binding protein LepA
VDKQYIRNFSIIAHIDHGKSTLSDRIIEMTNALQKREMQQQVLDSMDLERERGITIKLNAVQLNYHDPISRHDYTLHLIDTPGHIDFTYEVSRSLAACDGTLLIVDATQGVEAQTLSNLRLALENKLVIIPVINKIDLASADVEKTKEQIHQLVGINTSVIPCVSAKSGLNMQEVLSAIIKLIPPPNGDINAPLQALIFDSYYDPFKGVVCLVCIKNGSLKLNQSILMMSSKRKFIVTDLGIKTPKVIRKDILSIGEVG